MRRMLLIGIASLFLVSCGKEGPAGLKVGDKFHYSLKQRIIVAETDYHYSFEVIEVDDDYVRVILIQKMVQRWADFTGIDPKKKESSTEKIWSSEQLFELIEKHHLYPSDQKTKKRFPYGLWRFMHTQISA